MYEGSVKGFCKWGWVCNSDSTALRFWFKWSKKKTRRRFGAVTHHGRRRSRFPPQRTSWSAARRSSPQSTPLSAAITLPPYRFLWDVSVVFYVYGKSYHGSGQRTATATGQTAAKFKTRTEIYTFMHSTRWVLRQHFGEITVA